ncbi:MAG: polysaccharide deacetylase family protein [Candidatus Acidiferrum sp.]
MTRILKCVISLAVFCAMFAGRIARALFGRAVPGRCMVLYYHSVPGDQRARFARQLDVILRHAQTIDVTRPIALRPGGRYAGITFDDAFENFIDEALPELRKRNMPSTMFVISGGLGKGFGPAGHAEKVMSAEQLRSLPEELVSIGSHTVSHPFLPELSAELARGELLESKGALESLLKREVSTFSFPFGGFSAGLVQLCREAGYQRIFTTLPSFAFLRDSNEFVVGRIRVDPTDWPIEFRLKLAGAYNWLPLAFALKRKLRGNTSVERAVSQPAAERSMVREWSGS